MCGQLTIEVDGESETPSPVVSCWFTLNQLRRTIDQESGLQMDKRTQRFVSDQDRDESKGAQAVLSSTYPCYSG